MNIIVLLNGQDVTDICRLENTRITYDTGRRITTAELSFMGQAPGRTAGYDVAFYDKDHYAFSLSELYEVVILDGRDGVTKLFHGQIYTIDMEHSDSADFALFYRVGLNDWAAWLDRSIAWGDFTLPLPASDKQIIQALIGKFCPRIHAVDIAQIVPTIQAFDWKTKTCRQILDDICALSMGTWTVDFDANLHYRLAANAPAAPYSLSTSSNGVTSFPVKVNSYRHDFTNPINRAYVRGIWDTAAGVLIEASYADPVSIQQYGEYASAEVDEQIITAWDASLRAKATVIRYAYPIEQGSFTVWEQDWLKVGMQVSITEDAFGINASYLVRTLTMVWEDKTKVRYEAEFGDYRPDLETILRVLSQRTKWASSMMPVANVPPQSIGDEDIRPPGLSGGSISSVSAGSIQGYILASQIGSVNAGTILGYISAGQIASVNAGAIVGAISAEHIGSVNSTAIQGFIGAGQIGSVNATSIQGVILAGQLGNQIVDDLAKFGTSLRPVQIIKIGDPWPPTMPNDNFPPKSYFYYQPDGNFYRVTDDGTTWVGDNNPQGSLMSFFNIGMMKANTIIGLIAAGQIQSITAGQITGQVHAGQISTVNASSISGQLIAGQIATVNATAIQGVIAADNIGTINASKVTGVFNYTQIGSVNAATITIGLIGDNQIGAVNGSKIVVNSIDSYRLNTYAIEMGDLGNVAARIRVWWGGAVVAQIGYLGEIGAGAYGGWFKVLGAGGTSWADARVYTDTSGNLWLRNVDLNISGKIFTSPTTFDPVYSSLALRNVDGADAASFISRGLVVYYNSARVGYVGRAPTGGWMEMEFLTGGSYVYIAGNSGVRSDAGYLVGSLRVINSSGQFTGPVTGNVTGTCSGPITGTVSGPISTNSAIYTGSTCQAQAGYYGGSFQGSAVSVNGTVHAVGGHTGGPFTGQGVNCPGYGIGGAGFNPQGYSGQTYNIGFRDSGGGFCTLWLNGVNYGAVQLRVVGGVVVGIA